MLDMSTSIISYQCSQNVCLRSIFEQVVNESSHQDHNLLSAMNSPSLERYKPFSMLVIGSTAYERRQLTILEKAFFVIIFFLVPIGCLAAQIHPVEHNHFKFANNHNGIISGGHATCRFIITKCP
jgi:hypothetical protein